MSYTAMTITCERCGSRFSAYPDRKGPSGKYPRFCSRACYSADRAGEAASKSRAAAVIRVPDCFYIDHMERALPTPEDVGNSRTYAVVRVDDPALSSLLDDAEYYAHPSGPDNAPRGVVASARATVRAIRNVIGWEGAEPAILRLRKGGAR